MSEREWEPTSVVAWTEREGPRRPPPGAARWMWTATAATLGVVVATIFMTDALCPDHRVWVENLALLAIFGSVVAIVGLIRGWAIAPLTTIGVAGIGAVIGALDAAHSPFRGGAIAAGFVLALLFSAWLAVRELSVGAWDRRLRREASADVDIDQYSIKPSAAVADHTREEALTPSE